MRTARIETTLLTWSVKELRLLAVVGDAPTRAMALAAMAVIVARPERTRAKTGLNLAESASVIDCSAERECESWRNAR